MENHHVRQSAQQPIICETLESEAPQSDSLNNEKDSNIPETNNNDLGIDYDLSLYHSLVGSKIQATHDNG